MARTLTDDDLDAIVAAVMGDNAGTTLFDAVAAIQAGVALMTAAMEQADKGLPTEHTRWQATALESAPITSKQDVRDAALLAPTPDLPISMASIEFILQGVAKEATLVATQGVGWTVETLVALGALLAAIKARTDLIGVASVAVTSPQSADGGALSLVAGDDYLYDDNRQLGWTDTGDTWPDLTGGCTFYLDGDAFSKAAVVISNASPKSIRLELTAAETAAMADLNPKKRWHMVGLNADDPAHTATFLRGTIKVERL